MEAPRTGMGNLMHRCDPVIRAVPLRRSPAVSWIPRDERYRPGEDSTDEHKQISGQVGACCGPLRWSRWMRVLHADDHNH
jgi:hypothetical protein